MAEKGFLEELAEGIGRHLDMKLAIKASRDENGKIDVGKATGLFVGHGHTSSQDFALFGAMLGAEGAFDDDSDSSATTDYPVYKGPKKEDDWRERHFWDEINVDPDLYDSEEEYLEACEEKQAWIDAIDEKNIDVGNQYSMWPEEYDSYDEFIEDLKGEIDRQMKY